MLSDDGARAYSTDKVTTVTNHQWRLDAAHRVAPAPSTGLGQFMKNWLVLRSMRRYRRFSTIAIAFIATLLSCSVSAGQELSVIRDVVNMDETVTCEAIEKTDAKVTIVRTTLAGVPAILRVPRTVTRPPIVLWHGYGPPASERAMMEALPLDDVPSIKVYLGLPLFGDRAPAGGLNELARLQGQDFGLLVFKPTVVGAGDELPRVVDALKRRACMEPEAKIGLVGFSAGGAAALYVMSQRKVSVGTVALINASTGLSASIEAVEHATGRPYAWSPESHRLAETTDATRHAADIVQGRVPPAVLLLQGSDDLVIAPKSASALYDSLLPYYLRTQSEQRIRLEQLAGISHNWVADKQALDFVRGSISDWFLHH